MREIKFRGKCIKTGEWVSVGYVEDALTAYSMTAEVAVVPAGCYPIAVKPETVGQFTGLHDKNGEEVFEGDIVSRDDFDIGEIKQYHGCWMVFYSGDRYFNLHFHLNQCEIIGSIHEAPEAKK